MADPWIAAAPSCGSIIDEIAAQLHGWGSTFDRITSLKTPLSPTDTQIVVDFAFGQSVGISPGIIEIDSEQLYVVSVDPNSGICTLANGFGRGFGGTVAASHAAGAKVTTRPRFPRKWLFNAVNEVISSLYPALYTVDTFTATATYPQNEYPLPILPPMTILNAEWQDYIGNWHKCRSYSLDAYDATFRLGGGVPPGRPLRVTYGSQPSPFTSESDAFGVTGLPPSCADVIMLGVVSAQVPGLDISRAQVSSIEQTDRSRDVPASIAVQLGQYLGQQYQKRLMQESESLHRQWKPRLNFTF